MHDKLKLFLERIYDFNDYSEETLKNAERIISEEDYESFSKQPGKFVEGSGVKHHA